MTTLATIALLCQVGGLGNSHQNTDGLKHQLALMQNAQLKCQQEYIICFESKKAVGPGSPEQALFDCVKERKLKETKE